MAEINITIEKQVLTIRNREVISFGDKNYDTCFFQFDINWSNFVKTAVFYQDRQHVQYAVLDENNRCIIPAAAMADAKPMYIGVFGVDGNKVLTSTLEHIDIVEAAVSGDNIELEPTDNVFLAIIAQYQLISRQMEAHNQTAASLYNDFNLLSEQVADDLRIQNTKLDELGAFDTERVMNRLDEVQAQTNGFSDRVNQVLARFTVLSNVVIQFTDGVCTIHSDLIKGTSYCDVYFDEYSYELACHAPILVSTFDGYVKLSTSVLIEESLKADIIVRRFE